jgi:hypothetical protein
MGGWAAVGAALLAKLGAAFALLLSKPALIAAAIALAAYLIYRNWGRIGPFLASLWQGIAATAEAAWNGIATFLSGLWESIRSSAEAAWNGIAAFFGRIGSGIATAVGSSLDGVKSVIAGIWKDIETLFKAFTPLVWLQAAVEPIVEWVTAWGETLYTAFDRTFGRIGRFVGGIFDGIAEGFRKIGGLVEGALSWGSGPSTTQVKATAEQAAAAKAAIDALAPAARAAVAAARAEFAGVSFHSHGVALMKTLAAGIRAGAADAVDAVRGTVQRMRDLLPHSPAKTGPLSDLDRVRFGETLAGSIMRGTPSALAAATALAAGLAATVPGGAEASTAGGGLARGGSVTSIAPVFNITLQGGGDDLVERLREAAHEVAEIVQRELSRRGRAEY